MGAEGEGVVATGRGLNMDAESVRRRHGVWAELLLAVPPTLIVLGTVFFIEVLRHRQVLFASLASSAFLIYRDPGHRMNTLRVMVSAHVVAVAWGVGAELLFHPGYVAAAVAMVGAIVVLIVLDVVHPPAVSTALGFAFVASQDRVVDLFLLALIMVAVLALMQRAGGGERDIAEYEDQYEDKNDARDPIPSACVPLHDLVPLPTHTSSANVPTTSVTLASTSIPYVSSHAAPNTSAAPAVSPSSSASSASVSASPRCVATRCCAAAPDLRYRPTPSRGTRPRPAPALAPAPGTPARSPPAAAPWRSPAR